jgi:hypothetical protein
MITLIKYFRTLLLPRRTFVLLRVSVQRGISKVRIYFIKVILNIILMVNTISNFNMHDLNVRHDISNFHK